MSHEQSKNLEQLLELLIKTAQENKRLKVGSVIHVIGERSFGTLLLVVGLLLVSPLSGIPGMASFMALIILLITIQLLIGRAHFWLPEWLLERSIESDKAIKAIQYLKRPAQTLDRWVKPRLSFLARKTGSYVIALACVAIALVMPAMELVPFSASTAGVALSLFGMALFARDGILALFSLLLTGLLFGLLVYHFFS